MNDLALRRLSGIVALTAALSLLIAGRARASQDDVPLPLAPATALFSDARGFLTATQGQMDIAAYPFQGRGHHRWHGRVRGDVAIAQPTQDSLVRLGLSAQTIADDRNEIAFRLTRVFYDAFTGYEHRLGTAVAYAGYRHRCTHGADAAVDGRVLIRSGPEIGYRLTSTFGAWSVSAHAFGHASLIAQNDDVRSMPRALLASAGELRVREGWASFLLSAGFGAAFLSRAQDWTATIDESWRDVRVAPLPTVALGTVLHGERADFQFLAHYQRILDTGVGERSDAMHLLSLQLAFLY
jgi:hypothetical protein